MKCIKEKCMYCQPNLLKASYSRCVLEDMPFKTGSEVECIIEKSIARKSFALEKLKRDLSDIKMVNDELGKPTRPLARVSKNG